MDLEPPSLFLSSSFDIMLVFPFVILIVLLMCSALISGAEVAMFSLNATDLDEEVIEEKSHKISLIKKLLKEPQRLLATILIANNLVNIAIVLLFASVSDRLYQNIDLVFWGINMKFIVDVGLVTFLLLLFGEILPKIYASRNKLSFAMFMVTPLHVFNILFTLMNIPMQKFTQWVQDKFGSQTGSLSVGELSQALELTSESDTTEEEQMLLQGIVTFGNTEAKQVMTPRTEVFALDEELSYKEVMSKIIEMGYSRIPIYKESIDNILGILYVKDLIPYIDTEDLDWTSLVREAYFVPENKKLDDLLAEFKQLKIHLALVVDEYGGTSGIITMEDVIEEIVGEISDEFDEDDLMYSKLDDYTYIFEGKISLIDFYEVVGLEESEIEEFEKAKGESETIAGLILETFKGFPKKNDKVKIANFLFTVEAFENRRIKQVKFTIQ